MSEILLKKSLLLTHGTIYGDLFPYLTSYPFADITNSLDRFNFVGFDWDQDIPFLNYMAAAVNTGTVTDNTPVDVVTWTGSGDEANNMLEPWQQCITLLTRL